MKTTSKNWFVMKRRSLIILSVFMFMASAIVAQEARITLRAPAEVGVGQQFAVTYEVNARPTDFKTPTFNNFNFLGGPSQSSSSSTQIINGNVTRSMTISYTYFLSASTEGTFTIPKATCRVDGRVVESNTAQIKVVKASDSQQQRSQGQGRYRQQVQQQDQPTQIDDNTLFVKISANKTNVYQGEEIIITYRIYTQVNISQYQIDKLPINKGFWTEDLGDDNTGVQQYEETINGKRYLVGEIRKAALFPQESGLLTIEPLQLEVLAQLPSQRRRTGSIFDLFDDAFFNTHQSVKKTLVSNSLKINVKPLPTPPDNFTGGVGNFSLSAKVDTDKIKANEALTYSLTVSGTGNLMLIDDIDVKFPEVFEVYDPKVVPNIKHSAGGVSGSKTFEWILIPRSQGNYKIPEATLVFFNPKTKSYETKKTQSFNIRVDKGDANAMTAYSSKSDVKLLNSDINYIMTGNPKLTQAKDSFFNTLLFWILLVLPMLLAVAVVVYGRKLQESRKDIGSMKLRKATSLAKKRLRRAEAYLTQNDDEKFYIEIYQAIWGYISDKFTIPLSSLSTETVQECLETKNVDASIVEKILKTLGDVNFARFAPGDSSTKKQGIYEQALQMILDIEKQLK